MAVNWQPHKPAYPKVGDVYYDYNINHAIIWNGVSWMKFSRDSTMSEEKPLIPSQENLDKYPTLKSTWEEYLVVKKLLGI